MAFFDIYLLEALINGILLGGVFALLSLGLNLIFGVIDVVWICYAELIMLGMYGMYFVYSVYHAPFAIAAVTCIAGVAVLGVILHVLVIAPLLGAAPINQLLATGGVLFFLQSAATVMFGIEFKNLGLRLPVLKAAQGHSRNAARPEAPARGGDARSERRPLSLSRGPAFRGSATRSTDRPSPDGASRSPRVAGCAPTPRLPRARSTRRTPRRAARRCPS